MIAWLITQLATAAPGFAPLDWPEPHAAPPVRYVRTASAVAWGDGGQVRFTLPAGTPVTVSGRGEVVDVEVDGKVGKMRHAALGTTPPPSDRPLFVEEEARAFAGHAAPAGVSGRILGSLVNLRDEPGGNVIARLGYGLRVKMAAPRGDATLVRVRGGPEGYVPTKLVAERVPIGGLVNEALRSSTVAQRLLWAQRLAVANPTEPGVQLFLAQLYRAVDEPSLAKAAVEQAQVFGGIELAGVHPSTGPGTFLVSASRVHYYNDTGNRGALEDRPQGLGGALSGVPIWVLPAVGPAVEGRIVQLSMHHGRECADTFTGHLTVQVRATLGQADIPIAWTLGVPPDRWLTTAPAADLEQARVEAQALRDADGQYRAPGGEDGPWTRALRRDVDGDGKVDLIAVNQCAMTVFREGLPSLETSICWSCC